MKDFNKNLTGLAGECAVMTQLCLKGYAPSMTYNNCPSIDIICYNPELKKTVTIQVKTVREKKNGNKIYSFPVMGNRDEREEFYKEVSGAFVFVYIDCNDLFHFYILSKEQFITLSRKIEDDYDALVRSKPIKPKSPMAMPRKQVLEFENKWENLWI